MESPQSLFKDFPGWWARIHPGVKGVPLFFSPADGSQRQTLFTLESYVG